MFLHEPQRRRADSALQLTMSTARAKIQGLRILIDGSCLGPIENGTQVQTLALIEALASRDDVQWVGVGLGGGGAAVRPEGPRPPEGAGVTTQALRFPTATRPTSSTGPSSPAAGSHG